MNHELDDLVRKAIFCQGEGNMQQALSLWARAAQIAPLDHPGRFNYLLCRRSLHPQRNYMGESLDLARESMTAPYSDHCDVIAMLCSYEAGRLDISAGVAVILAENVMDAERAGRANVWDLAGEPSLVSEDGSVAESKSGANIIRCIEALICTVPHGSRDERPLKETLQRYQLREQAMIMGVFPVLPPRKAWWKFW